MTIDDLLMPGGQPLGVAGKKPAIREVSGSLADAIRLFQQLTQNGKDVTPPTYPGTMIELPGGERIGLRQKSKSGPPTIDVRSKRIPIDKIKFL